MRSSCAGISMLDPAPRDFWQQVIDRVARLIWEREIRSNGVPAHPPLPRPAERVPADDEEGKR